VQHEKLKPARVYFSPRFGNMAHVVRDQAADGVELEGHLPDSASRTPKAASTRSMAVSPLTRYVLICQPEDITVIFGDVELIFDFPYDLFKYILNGDQPGYAAKLVDHDRKMVPIASKFAQQDR
jgi:hypothetical protein